ncbi:MAG: WG repeat-containing protein [Saprospiraceae bacterium]|nr:WG repeat-containing protein [Saprospiraceae bacterium]
MKTKILFTIILLFSSLLSFTQELVPFQNDDGKWGLKNEKGKTKVKPNFDNILKLQAYQGEDENSNLKFYYIVNNGGEMNTQVIYDTIFNFNIDEMTGEEIIEPVTFEKQYQYITGGKFGLLDPNGKTVLKTIYDSLAIPYRGYRNGQDYIGLFLVNMSKIKDASFFKDIEYREMDNSGLLYVCLNNKWGIMNLNGKQLLEIKYDSYYLGDFYINNIPGASTTSSGEVYFKVDDELVKNSNAYLVWDKQESDYSSEDYYKNKLYLYLSNSIIDSTSIYFPVTLINPDDEFDIIDTLLENRVPMLIKGDIVIVNNKGKEIAPTAFDDLYFNPTLYDDYGNIKPFGYVRLKMPEDEIVNYNIDLSNIVLASKFLWVKKNKKWGLIDVEGNTIIEPKYDSISYDSKYDGSFSLFNHNVLAAITDNNGEFLYKADETIVNNSNIYWQCKLYYYEHLDTAKIVEIENSLFVYFTEAVIDTLHYFDTLAIGIRDYSVIDSIIDISIPNLISGKITLVNGKSEILNVEPFDNIATKSILFRKAYYYDDWDGLGTTNYESIDVYKYIAAKKSNFNVNDNFGYFVNGNPEIDSKIILIERDEKWGFLNLKDYSKIECKYDSFAHTEHSSKEISFYNNNVLAAFINILGDFLYTADEELVKNSNAYLTLELDIFDKNEEVYDYQKDLYLYLNNAIIDTVKWIDTVLIETPELELEEYYESREVPVVKEGGINILNHEGKELTPTTFENIYFSTQNNNLKTGILINKYLSIKISKEQIINYKIDISNIKINSKILFAQEQDNWWQIDVRENTAKKLDFKIERFFSDVLIVTRNDSLFIYNVLDSKLIPIKEMYDNVIDEVNDLYLVKKGDKFGFINKKGRIVLDCKFDNIEKLNNGLFRTKIEFTSGNYEKMLSSKYGLIDSFGNEILACEHYLINDFYDGLAIIRSFTGEKDEWGYPETSNYGFIDESGKVVIPLIYKDAFHFSEDLAAVSKNGKWGFIDKTGKEIIPFIYDERGNSWRYKGQYFFLGGIVSVKKNDKWGYLNKNGKVVIPLIYDYVSDVREGEIYAEKDNEVFYFTEKGERIEK